MAKIILPKDKVDVSNETVIFLAGPIRGATNWHYEAMDILLALDPHITIASPRRTLREDLEQHRVYGKESYDRQRAWERYYLEKASKQGSILFWLPKEHEHNCAKAYGAITRFEIGQWLSHYKHDNSLHVCFGSDGEFPELRTIALDIAEDAPNKIIYDSLEKTCKRALELAKR